MMNFISFFIVMLMCLTYLVDNMPSLQVWINLDYLYTLFATVFLIQSLELRSSDPRKTGA